MQPDNPLLLLPEDIEIPEWCRRGRLVYNLELTEETPSNNKIKNMHWMVYRQLRQKWRVRIFARLGGVKPTEPLDQAGLLVVRRSAGMLDWDNAYGGLKPLLDCLVTKTKRNPDGLGLVHDDSPKHMPYPPFLLQRPALPNAGSCQVLIFDLT